MDAITRDDRPNYSFRTGWACVQLIVGHVGAQLALIGLRESPAGPWFLRSKVWNSRVVERLLKVSLCSPVTQIWALWTSIDRTRGEAKFVFGTG